MRRMILGLLDADLGRRSGGVYDFVCGMLKSIEDQDIILKVIGTSRDLRRLEYSSNVIFLPPKWRVFGSDFKFVRIIPFFGLNLWSTRFDNGTAVSLSYSVKRLFLNDIDWWFFPHSFLPIPELSHAVAYCWDLQHHVYPEYFPGIVHWLRHKAEASLSNVSRIICASEFTKNELLNRYPHLAERTSVIHGVPYIAADLRSIKSGVQDPRENNRESMFLYPAVDWPHKNHVVLLNATRILRDQIGPVFKVILTGARRRGDWLKHQIEQQRLADTVIDLGVVSHAKLLTLYSRATALVFPSLYEGFGLPLVEAMIFGVPIIASNCAAIPEIVGKAALLCDPNSAAAFSLSMENILNGKELCRTMSNAAYARSKLFVWSNWWREFIVNLSTL